MSNATRSRMLGRLLMVVAVLQLLAFCAGLARRSYLVVALPVGGALAALSALAFWVGYTMAYARWDDDEAAETTAETTAEPVVEPFEHAPPPTPPAPSAPPEGPATPAAPGTEPAAL